MEAFYFTNGERRLFGIHQAPPAAARSRSSAVVFCYPLGPEYFRVHRAFRVLALRLAEAGFHVLRFDYYGSGDSAGASEETDMAGWLGDIGAAIEEAKDASGAARVSLVGVRLGATLAATAARGRRDVERLALWDPVADGRAYLDELIALHQAWRVEMLPDARAGAAYRGEIFGLPVTAALRAGLETVVLPALERDAERVLVVESAAPSATLLWRERMKALGARLDYEAIAGERSWLAPRDVARAWVPGPILGAIERWFAADA